MFFLSFIVKSFFLSSLAHFFKFFKKIIIKFLKFLVNIPCTIIVSIWGALLTTLDFLIWFKSIMLAPLPVNNINTGEFCLFFFFKNNLNGFFKFILVVIASRYLYDGFMFNLSFIFISFYLIFIFIFFTEIVSKSNLIKITSFSIILSILSLYAHYFNFFSFLSNIFYYNLQKNSFNVVFIKNTYYHTNFLHIIHIGDQGYLGLSVKNSFILYISPKNITFVILTLLIGFFVNLYTFNYMRNEPFLSYFVILLNLFLFSMILLLTSYSLSCFFLGWELIGVFSFMLINFWTNKISSKKSAFKAFIFNKLSDLSFMIIFILNIVHYSIDSVLNFNSIFFLTNIKIIWFDVNIPLYCFYSLFLIICCYCKSAQLGFHVWLPDSMEAPIPASALIHSATLVSAGLYLMHLFTPVFDSNFFSWLILFWSGSTALYGGLVAAFQTDLKKILAYSTISHCGFLFCLLVFNLNDFFYLYVFIHGSYKSLSFILIGFIIGESGGYQDFRKIGSFSKNYYFYKNSLMISLFNLAGLPFGLGFFSKYFLLINVNSNLTSKICSVPVYLASYNGFFYSFNLLKNTFFNPYKGFNKNHKPGSDILRTKKIHYHNNIFFLVISSSLLMLSLLVVVFTINCYNFYSLNRFKFDTKSLVFLDLFNFFYLVVLYLYYFSVNKRHLLFLNFYLLIRFFYEIYYIIDELFLDINYKDFLSIANYNNISIVLIL